MRLYSTFVGELCGDFEGLKIVKERDFHKMELNVDLKVLVYSLSFIKMDQLLSGVY